MRSRGAGAGRPGSDTPAHLAAEALWETVSGLGVGNRAEPGCGPFHTLGEGKGWKNQRVNAAQHFSDQK